ncbi:hypothetical protein HK098_006566 [Nowakowskiella sp. JEL0407]|nr:hypothetical protein HK098_006566 [Nowakowskiella sp. JEL0407]
MLWKNGVDQILAFGVEPYLRGMVVQSDQTVDTFYTEDFRAMPVDPPFFTDLAALTIQRSRDLMFPSYNECRQSFNLTTIEKWSDLTNDTYITSRLQKLYGDINNLECFVGVLSENHPHTFLSEMSRRSIKDQLLRLRSADRWYYESPGVLEPSELKEINDMDLGELVTRNTNISWFPHNPMISIPQTLFEFYSRKKTVNENFNIPRVDIGSVRVSWVNNLLADSSLVFQIESNVTGWFGFGFGKNMKGALIFLVTNQFDNYWNVYACDGEEGKTPTKSKKQNLIYNISNISGSRNTHGFTFSWTLNTTYMQQNATSIPIISAWSDDTALNYHGTLNRMKGYLDLEASIFSSAPVVGNIGGLKMLHGITLGISTGLIIPSGIFVARYYQGLHRWLNIHEALMTTVASNFAMAAFTAIIGDFSGSMKIFHSIVGMILTGIVGLTYFSGLFSSRWNFKVFIKRTRIIRNFHKTCGWTLYLFSICNATVGVYDITSNKSIQTPMSVMFVTLSLLFGISLLGYGEINKIWMKKKFLRLKSLGNKTELPSEALQYQNPLSRSTGSDAMFLQNLPTFDWTEFNNRVAVGSQWIVIDGIIYDVGGYVLKHPGGPASINLVIGLDATNHFEPSMQNQNSSNIFQTYFSNIFSSRSISSEKSSKERVTFHAHVHSRLAHFQLMQLAVGKLPPAQAYSKLFNNITLPGTSNSPESEYFPPNDSGRISGIKSTASLEVEESSLRQFSGFSSGPTRGHSITQSGNFVYRVSISGQSDRFSTRPNRENYFANSNIPYLSLDQFYQFRIISRTLISHEKSLHKIIQIKVEHDPIRFEPGQFVFMQFANPNTGVVTTRSYTPILFKSDNGIDFIIKVYPDGIMSSHLETATTIRMRGPVSYLTKILNLKTSHGCWSSLGMIAGGTGLTALLSLIEYHIENAPRDPRTGIPQLRMHLLNINNTEYDMFLLKELEALQQASMGTLVITNLVTSADSVSESWNGLVGEITPEILKETMPIQDLDPRLISNVDGGVIDGDSRCISTEESHMSNELSDIPESSVQYSRTSSASNSDQNDLRIIVCGSMVLSVLVKNILRSLGYPEDVILTLENRPQ